MDAHLDALATDPHRADRDARIGALIACPRVLAPILTACMTDAGPKLREVLLEAMTGRFYRVRPLEPFRHRRINGVPFALTRYDRAGAHSVAAAFVDAGALDAAMHALARIADELPSGEPLIADFYARTPAGRTRDELAAEFAGRVAAAGLPDNVLRVVIALCEPARGRGMSAVDVFTLRRDSNGVLNDDVSLRGVHPEIAERLRLWRLAEFELDRLPSAEDVYLLRGTGRSNPADERLFAVAEVRDLTPVRADDLSLIHI